MFITNALLTHSRRSRLQRVCAVAVGVSLALTTLSPQLTVAAAQTTAPNKTIFTTRVSAHTLKRGASFTTGKGIVIGLPGKAASSDRAARLVVKQLTDTTIPETTDQPISKVFRVNLRQAQVTGSIWLKLKTTDAVAADAAVIKYWNRGTDTWQTIDSSVADDHTVQGSLTAKNNVIVAVFAQTPPPAPVKTTADTPTFSGAASWYANPYNGSAMTLLPRGSVVKVQNLDNGKEVTVRINDYGPAIPGRVIDLDDDSFAAIAPLSSGVIHHVRVTQVK